MTAPAEPGYKRCPDCAEQVLAAARKCRFCGYRFDQRRSPGKSLIETLLPGLRRDSTDGTLEEILADWGTSLEPEESVQWFRLADVDERPGYLLLTSRRLVFYRQISRTRHERELEYPLALVTDVRLSGRPMKRRLEVRAGVLEHTIQAPGHGELERLHRHLGAAVGRSPAAGEE